MFCLWNAYEMEHIFQCCMLSMDSPWLSVIAPIDPSFFFPFWYIYSNTFVSFILRDRLLFTGIARRVPNSVVMPCTWQKIPLYVSKNAKKQLVRSDSDLEACIYICAKNERCQMWLLDMHSLQCTCGLENILKGSKCL